MPYAPMDDTQRKTQAIKLLLRGRKYYEKNPQVLYALMQAKAHSDLGDFTSKNVILKEMIKARPEEFKIDSEEGDVIGLTHLPSNFKIHTVRGELQGLPQLMSTAQQPLEKTAAKYSTELVTAGGGVLGALIPLLISRGVLGWKSPVRSWEPITWAGGGAVGAVAANQGLKAGRRFLANRAIPFGYDMKQMKTDLLTGGSGPGIRNMVKDMMAPANLETFKKGHGAVKNNWLSEDNWLRRKELFARGMGVFDSSKGTMYKDVAQPEFSKFKGPAVSPMGPDTGRVLDEVLEDPESEQSSNQLRTLAREVGEDKLDQKYNDRNVVGANSTPYGNLTLNFRKNEAGKPEASFVDLWDIAPNKVKDKTDLARWLMDKVVFESPVTVVGDRHELSDSQLKELEGYK